MSDPAPPKPTVGKLQSNFFNKPSAEVAAPKVVPNFKIAKKAPAGTSTEGSTTATTSSPALNSNSTSSTKPVISPVLKPAAVSQPTSTTSISQPTTPSLKPVTKVFKPPGGSTSAPTTPVFKGAPIRKSPSSSDNLAAVANGGTTGGITKSPTNENLSSTSTTPIRKSPSISDNISSTPTSQKSSTSTTPTQTTPTLTSNQAIRPQILVAVLPPIESPTSSSTSSSTSSTPIPVTPKETTPTIKTTSKPIITNSNVNEILSNDISKESSKKIEKEKGSEYVRVLSNKKGDFNSLSVVRGDILEIKEKGDKDISLGCNGYKTASFSISNTKQLYPKENEPTTTTQKVVAIKDIRANNNYTVIRGDVLCILETKKTAHPTILTYVGRVKVGLDGWGEKLEFSSDCVRQITDQEYLLFSDLLDVVIEISEQLMDPELFLLTTNNPTTTTSSNRSSSITSSIKNAEKQIEKNQLILRDRVKSIQTVREKLLNCDSPNPQLEATLRKEIEITRSFLSNEFYIVNNDGQIVTSETESPMKLLKYHYQMNDKNNGNNHKDNLNDSTSSMSPTPTPSSKSKSSLQLGISQQNNHSSSSLLSDNLAAAKQQKPLHWEYGQIIADIKFNKCSLPPKKNFEFYFSLYNFSQSRYITEQIQVEWESVVPSPSSTTQIVSFKCIFKNIEPSDITEDICFLCRVVRKGPFKDLDESTLKKGTNVDFRRPYAFACISIPNLVVENQIGLERTGNLQFYSTSSTDILISQIPDFLMKNSDDEIKKHLEMVPKITSGLPQSILPISLSFYDIPYDSFSSKFTQFSTIVKAEKLEHKIVFTEKIHKFYLTLDSGKFAQGKKMEIVIRVRLDDGEYLQNCMSLGSTNSGNYISEIRTSTCILNSNGTTIWNESIHFNIPEKHFSKAHILFFIRNRSNSSSKEKSSLVGFSFLKLGNDNSTVLSNGDHSISIYKLNSMDNLPISTYIDLNSQIGINMDTVDSNYPSPTSSSSSPLISQKSSLNLISSSSGKDKSSSSSKESKESKSDSILKKNESLKIKSLFHSSDFIQHSSVIQLIDWKNHMSQLPSLLDRFKFVDTIQIMRHLNKILDSLLSIFDMYSNESSTNNEQSDIKPNSNTLSVYNTIVFVMGLLTDERTNRFKHFKSEMDHYIIEQFSFSTTHKHLLKCICYSIQDISTKETAKISNTLKALDYMFQLITKSRLVYIREQQSISSDHQQQQETQWKEDLRKFLGLLNNLMSNSNEKLLIVPQTFALRNFAVIMKGLSNFFNTTELCVILSDFMESVYYSDKNFYQSKLTIYHKILSTQLPIGSNTYQHLLPALISTIDQHLNKGEELRLSNQLLALLLETIETLDPIDRNKAINLVAIVFNKMFTLVDQLLSTTITNDVSAQSSDMSIESTYLLSNFYTILHYFIKCGTPISNNKYSNHFEKYIEENQKEEKTIKPFIKKLLRVLEGFISRSIYSSKWPTLNLFQYTVTLSVLDIIEPYCIKLFTTQSDIEGWTLLLNAKFSFLTSSSLKSNENRINRLYHIKAQLDEIRSTILISIINTWNHLSKIQLQNQFNQSILVNLLYSLLNGNNDVNEFIQNLFYIIMKNEYLENKSLKRIESKTIEVLDKITIRERICDEDIFKYFLIKRLMDSVNGNSGNELLIKESKSFISNINQLLSLLFEFRTLPTDRAFEEERTIATLKMMEYFKDRKDTYIKYLYELLNQHLANGYFTEAGFAILLHSDLYGWNSDQIVPAYTIALNQQQTTMPQETSSDRKVRLLKMAIQYLDKGQVWERCITLLQDLKLHYEQTFNFKGLSEVSFQEAEFYEKILNTERFFAEYFRVGYYGKKFPVSIQGKEFLYKGFELERLSDFTGRILAKFPDAELLKSTSEPTVEIQNSDGKYLLITIVNPSCVEEIEKKQKFIIKGTPNNSKSYIKRNDVNVFVYSKPFEKASGAPNSNSNNKFGDLWIKNHFLLTDSSFPTIHRRAEVIKKLHVDLSPIENAINSVSGKNEELDAMVKNYEKQPQLNLNPLAMALNGCIDAAVNGGLSLYGQAFYQVPEKYRPAKEYLVKLSSELSRQANILEAGLIIHSNRCPLELRGLHEKLESFFPKLKSEIESINNSI